MFAAKVVNPADQEQATLQQQAALPLDEEFLVRCIDLLAEGTAINTPEILPGQFTHFRETVSATLPEINSSHNQGAMLTAIRHCLQPFEAYRLSTEAETRNLTREWHQMSDGLLAGLEASGLLGPEAGRILPIRQKLKAAEHAETIRALRIEVENLIGRYAPVASKRGGPTLRGDNGLIVESPTGLKGFPEAKVQLEEMLKNVEAGFVAFFHLTGVRMIESRFGYEAAQDCLMSVSSQLVQGMQSADRLYHLDKDVLMGILMNRPSREFAIGEMNRVAAQNRELTMRLEGRTVMLRVPISVTLHFILDYQTADEILAACKQFV